MRARHPLLVLALLALCAPGAWAGTEARPDIVDPAGDVSDPSVDILSAWLVAEKKGLRFHVKVADATGTKGNPDRVYWVFFRHQGVAASAAVGTDGQGRLRGYVGPLDGPDTGFQKGGMERAANDRVVEVKARAGPPSVYSGLIPWGAIPGLEPGATLVDLRAGTAKYDRPNGQWIPASRLDTATSTRVYTAHVESAGVLALVKPVVLGVSTLAGAGAGAWIAFRPRPGP